MRKGIVAAVCVACVVAACGGADKSSFDGPGGGGGGGGASSGGGGGGGGGGGLPGEGGVASFGDGAAGGFVGDAGCATATAKATKTPVYMLFILDGSLSMDQNGKWPAATQALQAVFGDIEKQADPGLAVGLIVFSDSKAGFLGPYPGPADVPIAFVDPAHLSALDGRLGGNPLGTTPTGGALQGGYGELGSYQPAPPVQPGGQKVLVLITDGVPNDNCAQNGTNYAANACVVLAGQELAMAPPKGPVLTFVIGTGVFPSTDLGNFDPSFLGYLAVAGGTGPKGCNPADNTSTTGLCYFEVDPTKGNQTQTEQAFEAAIDAIRGQVLSCTFPLHVDPDAGTLDPSKVNVTVDGNTVPQSPTSGWTYDDPSNPTSITFHGAACDALKKDPNASVEIVLGCTTVTAN